MKASNGNPATFILRGSLPETESVYHGAEYQKTANRLVLGFCASWEKNKPTWATSGLMCLAISVVGPVQNLGIVSCGTDIYFYLSNEHF